MQGWQLVKQVLDVEVDVGQQRFAGFTELTLQSNAHGAAVGSVVGLHARQLAVARVTVDGQEVRWEYKDYQTVLVPSDQSELRELRTLAAYRVKAFETSQSEGELRVQLPDAVVASGAAIRVRVDFEVIKGSGGLFYFLIDEDDTASLRSPHMFTHGRYGESSHVFPCINSPAARCPFTVVVRAHPDMTVICSGVLDSRAPVADGLLQAHVYSTGANCTARDIFVAVGPFVHVPDAALPLRLSHYCLPGFQASVEWTCTTLAQAHAFFEAHLGVPCPVPVFNSVFVEMPTALACGYRCGGIFADYLLYTEDVLDQRMDTEYELAVALAEQWVGGYVVVDEWRDMWIVQGLAHYLGMAFLRHRERDNNALWRLMVDDTEALFRQPREVLMRPLRPEHLGHAADMFHPYVAKKALLVLSMVERRVGSVNFKSHVLPQLFQHPHTLYNTASFLNKIADASQHVMTDIEQFWVSRGGYPALTCGFAWNQKRHYLEFALKQDLSTGQFSGVLPVRVQELDTAYNHEIAFSDTKAYAWDDFPVHTRPAHKKKKRASKASKAEEGAAGADGGAAGGAAAAAAAAAVAAEPVSAASAIVAEVKNDETVEKSPILFLHIDPDSQWIMRVQFHQPEEMWINMLESGDRNVVMERQAVLGLRQYRTASAIECLTALLNDPERYVRVRMEAASALAALAGTETDWKAAVALVNYIKETHYDASSGVLKPNDFSDARQYFLSKAVIEGLAEIRLESGGSYPLAVPLLVDMLRNNDNATNRYSDYAYLLSLLLAVGRLNPADPRDAAAARDVITRYTKLAELTPSYHSTISVATLRCRCETLLSVAQQCTVRDLEPFRAAFMRNDNCWSVRGVAAECELRVALKRLSAAEALAVLNALLDYVEAPRGLRLLQIRVLEVAAAAVRGRNRQAQVEDDAGSERLFSQPASIPHRALVDRLWALVCGPRTAFDETLRAAATLLYAALWSLDTPPPAASSRPGLVLASKATVDILAPSTAQRLAANTTWRDLMRSHDGAAAPAGGASIKEEPQQKRSKIDGV